MRSNRKISQGARPRQEVKESREGRGQDRASLYDEVTRRIISELEQGRVPWVQPWSSEACGAPVVGLPRNALTSRCYSGVNVLILWSAVIEHGWPSQGWLTFRQALEAGGNVRKGEHGTTVVYADRFTPEAEKARAQESGGEARTIAFLKRFTVFNVAQCEGLREGLMPEPVPLPEREIVPVAEAVIAASGIDFRIGGVKAFYSPGADFVQVPPQANDLLDENEASLARARSHVANLAHSLKTPLATLKIKLSDAHKDPEGDLAELVEQIDRAIRHHLGRARASSPGAPGRLSVAVAPVVADLVNALMRIHMDRNIAFHVMVPEDMPVRCDPQDLGEMLGNLLDNAAKWASSHVQITATERDRMLEIVVEDDGPGLGEAALKQVLLPGLRLDERGDGHGFGLPIARELAELHGGTLVLQKSALGGLRAALLLPR